MKRLVLFVIVFVFEVSPSFSQGNLDSRRKDSLQIVSMIKRIPYPKDTARVNYLNELTNKIFRSSFLHKDKAGWARPYVESSYSEAKKLNYKRGIGIALMGLWKIEVSNYVNNLRNKSDNTTSLNNLKKLVDELMIVAGEINDPQILGEAYDCEAGYFGRIQDSGGRIESLKKAIEWYRKAGNESRECEDLLYVSYDYLELGEFENAFEYCENALQLAKKLSVRPDPEGENAVWLQLSYMNMSDLYKAAGDYQAALNLLTESRRFHLNGKSKTTWGMETELGRLYIETGQLDSAVYYLKPFVSDTKFSYYWTDMGRVYSRLNKPDSALTYFNRAIDTMEKRGPVAAVLDGLRKCYYGKASILTQQNKYDDALRFVRKSIAYEQLRFDKLDLMNAYDLSAQIFHKLGRNDSAYVYLKKYIGLKDSMLTRQFLFRLSNYKKEAEAARKEAEIGFLNRDNKIKEQQLKQETQLKYSLLLGLLGLIAITIFIFRSQSLKQKNEWLAAEKTKSELQQKVPELEMQALRAQMNPHFIFNCLSSINRFIFKNDNKTASDYLTRFSRLIRMVLIHSQKKLIPLEDELEMIRLYLDLERLRFKDAFDYSITTTNIVEIGNIFIPPLLLQPFCENAVWHGLMHKESKGHLNIIVSEVITGETKVLHCVIEDDGIGRKKAAEMKSKSAEGEKSLGLRITTERLALLNQENNFSTFYRIEDMLDDQNEVAGTRVQLKIKYKESVEELF